MKLVSPPDEVSERRPEAGAPVVRAGEERFRLMVESVKDHAIFMLGATGRVETWNRGAEAIKGYRAGEIIGQHI
jgi:PAS domain-containing protein